MESHHDSQNNTQVSETTTSNEDFPLVYKDQFNKDVYWFCDYDQDKKITSIFIGRNEDGDSEKYIAYMDTMEQVKVQEELLKNVGWVRCKMPEITAEEHQLNRKERRLQEKKNKEKEFINELKKRRDERNNKK
jgi:hypothetical protein